MGTSVIEKLTFTKEKEEARLRMYPWDQRYAPVHTASPAVALLSGCNLCVCIIDELDSM